MLQWPDKFEITGTGIFYSSYNSLWNACNNLSTKYFTTVTSCIILLSYRLFHYSFLDTPVWLFGEVVPFNKLLILLGQYRYAAVGCVKITVFSQKSPKIYSTAGHAQNEDNKTSPSFTFRAQCLLLLSVDLTVLAMWCIFCLSFHNLSYLGASVFLFVSISGCVLIKRHILHN